MNVITIVVIIVIVALIVLIAINATFIYFPVARIERKVDGAKEDLQSLMPTIQTAVTGVEKLVTQSLSLESKVDNFVRKGECIACQELGSLIPSLCDGSKLNAVHIVCNPFLPINPPPSP